MKERYYVYFLRSEKNDKYYIGVTDNIDRRIKEHNSGLSKYTAPGRPWKLVRLEERESKSSAYKRERFLKSKKSRKIIEKIVRGGR